MIPNALPRSLLARLVLPLALALAHAPAAPAEDVVTKLPAPVEDYAVARSGECLVLKLKGQKGLTVYSTRSKALRTIDLPTSDFAFGAGGNRAVVFLKETNELQSFNLETLQPVKSKEFADPINVHRIVMGHSRDGLALIRVSRGVQALEQASNQLLNVDTLSIVRAKPGVQQVTGHNSTLRDLVHHRATGDLSRITEWATSHTPSGIGVYSLGPDGTIKVQYAHESAGFLAIGDDRLIYTGAGAIYDPDQPPVPPFNWMAKVGEVRDKSLIPGIGGLFYLGLGHNGSLLAYQAGQTTPLCLVGKFPD